MHHDHAVVDFAAVAAPLPLYARRLVTRLGMGRGVKNANRINAGVFVGYHARKGIIDTAIIPAKKR